MIVPIEEIAKWRASKPGQSQEAMLTKPQQVWSQLPLEQRQVIFWQIVLLCQQLIEPVPQARHNQETSHERR